MPASLEYCITISAAWLAVIVTPRPFDMVAAIAPVTMGALAEVPLIFA